LLHGDAAAKEAEVAAKAVFSAGASSDSLPTALVPQAELDAGMLVAAACTAAGLSKSNGEARRLIEQGAIRVNDEAVSDPNAKVSSADLKDGAIKISAGKKRHALIKAG
jgi:tyrosyl-tRNA synthetase